MDGLSQGNASTEQELENYQPRRQRASPMGGGVRVRRSKSRLIRESRRAGSNRPRAGARPNGERGRALGRPRQAARSKQRLAQRRGLLPQRAGFFAVRDPLQDTL